MVAEAGVGRLPLRAPRDTGIAARVTPGVAVFLFAATGAAWFLTTGPLSVFRAAAASLNEPVTPESWALLYSSIFGTFALVAGIVALGSYLAAPRPGRADACVETAPAQLFLRGEVVRLQRAVRSGGAAGTRKASVQLLRAQLAMLETRMRAARASDPEEIARVVEGGRDAMQEIITQLRSGGGDYPKLRI